MTIMKISNFLSDGIILAEIGKRIAHRRLDLEFTQAELARQAGVSKRTIERIEAGATAQMSSIIRIFRVLDLLSGLDQVIPEPGPSPMDYVKRKGRVRQRATSKRSKTDSTDPWSWDEDA
jgi:transcriptional regulator with XRE-family HTH domain